MLQYPPAYFITWTCYGSWLQGDSRGSTLRDRNTNRVHRLGHRTWARAVARHARRDPPMRLHRVTRRVVDRAIREHARVRKWQIISLNVRSNHVHVVIRAPEIAPELVMKGLKAWATRAMRGDGFIRSGQRVWTRHGSTRYLWDAESIARAERYVREQQDVREVWRSNP